VTYSLHMTFYTGWLKK